ncbi:MAG: D-alanyl-D-alanine carboxypeptidase [Clostridia bacterium]|nr:D-alanyl-D-alanine carboxypeptidase [Clostridia bacterium]
MNRKKLLSLILTMLIIFSTVSTISAIEIKPVEFDLNVKSAVLMDANTGTVLYEYNSKESLPPASVTKVMTLLLVFEALEKGKLSYNDILTVNENAASMGGSQIFLEPGEQMNVDDLLKSVIVASANDAALTLAEHVAGSEESFVNMMNDKAKELGMNNTHFENVTGLDDDVISHLTSAYDIALMSRELLKHEKVIEYATIWMDTVRNGEFGLSNTNRLVRFYKGITGLKTGSTSKAGFCVSASAKRDDLHLIAVIMGAETSKIRNAAATKLLDFGFANYSIFKEEETNIGEIKVLCGVKDSVNLKYSQTEAIVNKGDEFKIEKEIELPENITAPIKDGQYIGKVKYLLNGKIIVEKEIISSEAVEKITFLEYIVNIFKNFF